MSREAREALIDSLQVGDLIRRNGTLRLVRHVTRLHEGSGRLNRRDGKRYPGRVKSVTFAIRRCSWTGRPVTVIGRVDLYYGTLEIVRRNFPLARSFEEAVLQDEVSLKGPRVLSCEIAGRYP